MDAKAYLNRIGLSDKVEHSEAFLQQLQYHHVTSIPYENLDLVNKKLLSFNPDIIFEKIIRGKRGGYCFELNCLLEVFLKEQGFAVRSYLGRFLKGESGIPERRHRVVGILLNENTYIMDVGMGQSAPKHPLILQEGLVQNQFGESYKFIKEEGLGWTLYTLHKGNWIQLYAFTEEVQYEIDFQQASFFCERHPDSRFNKAPIVALKTGNGRKTINNNEFKIFENEALTYIEENISNERLYEILLQHFGIVWRKEHAEL